VSDSMDGTKRKVTDLRAIIPAMAPPEFLEMPREG
jgi:hypothetical protein